MEVVTAAPLLAYWDRRHRLTPAQFKLIDWQATGKMMATLPSGIQRWITKHAVGMGGVGKWRQRWGTDPTSQLVPTLRPP